MDFTNANHNNGEIFMFQSSSPPKLTQPTPPPPTVIHKAKYKRNSISKSPDEARQKRIELDAQVRRKHREQLITAKRIKHNLDAYKDDDSESEFDLTHQDIERLKSGLNDSDRESRLSSLKDLCTYLADPPDTLRHFVVNDNCIEILIKFLSGTDPDEQLQATWCITNIAAGPKEFCQKAFTAIPHLIAFLHGENISLQDQAAWAIGNLAAEAPECRDLLRANGVLNVTLAQTICFALSNLARGPNANLDEFFSAGITQHLLFYLGAEEMNEVVSEISWVLTYLTSSDDDKYTQILLKEGIVPLLVKHMRSFNHGPLALPLIRTLGNIASGPDDNTDILIQQPDFLHAMLEYIQSDCRPVKKESLWVMSNITATRRPEVLIKVFNAGFIPILSTIATHTNFDIRKEAAYSLLNIASHGEEYMRSLPHQDLLPGFLEFVRSQDMDLIRLGLGYIELLLTQVQNGQQLIEQMHGIDALESVTLLEEPSLRDTSTRLMDKYFGEDFYSNINEVQLVE
ncbi:3588_t:CDS:10 [Cetraspora pellucida]|uniref:3588_t:CDS:1 n=1 Tax=Cetraspora pellucida TaxID=1433469 RepID=A0ACA9K016_9GLOM|nr:3588_t:CDS:10 [Cetraspora pellucida]